jgi:Flp pilus assembly protein CpaB
VKKQTTILVLIGVILFIAGSAIAYASVQGASKHANSGSSVTAPVSTSAVVAKSDIPAGTSGQAMVSRGMVALELVPAKSFTPTDLTSLQALNDEVTTVPIQKGHAISTAELKASTSTISIPAGFDAMTVTIGGAGNLAGYLQPGSHVDIYANISKLSTGPNPPLPIPCTELAMVNVEVLDVSSTSPTLAGTKGGTGRSIPPSETLLLSVTPSQTRTLQFLTQNESISIVQPQQEVNPPPVGQCIGSAQGSSAP